MFVVWLGPEDVAVKRSGQHAKGYQRTNVSSS